MEVTRKIRMWTEDDVPCRVENQKANEAKTVVRWFQRRLWDMLDEHSEAIEDFEHLTCFLAQMPEKVLYKLRHRYVAFDMLTSDRHRWGRPGSMPSTVIKMQFSVKPPANREDSSAFFTLHLFQMAIMRSAVIDNVDFKSFIERIPERLVPMKVKKAAAEIAEMEPAKVHSAVRSLVAQL